MRGWLLLTVAEKLHSLPQYAETRRWRYLMRNVLRREKYFREAIIMKSDTNIRGVPALKYKLTLKGCAVVIIDIPLIGILLFSFLAKKRIRNRVA
jgi:hypothetical protein